VVVALLTSKTRKKGRKLSGIFQSWRRKAIVTLAAAHNNFQIDFPQFSSNFLGGQTLSGNFLKIVWVAKNSVNCPSFSKSNEYDLDCKVHLHAVIWGQSLVGKPGGR